jgi:hypothetical protein
MDNTTEKSKLAELLQIDSWSEAEREAFFIRSGQLIIDAAVNRLLVSLSEAEVAKLELYLDSHPELEDVISYVADTYPIFNELLAEEAAAFQVEAEQIVTPRPA